MGVSVLFPELLLLWDRLQLPDREPENPSHTVKGSEGKKMGQMDQLSTTANNHGVSELGFACPATRAHATLPICTKNVQQGWMATVGVALDVIGARIHQGRL